MRISIQLKIVMIYLCTILIIMLVSGSFIVYNTETRTYSSIQNTIETIAENLETRISWDLLDQLTASEFAKEIGSSNVNVEITILTPEGKVYYTTGRRNEGETISSEVVLSAISTKKPSTAPIEHFSELVGVKTTDHARPILDEDGDLQAIVYVLTSTEEVYENMQSIIKTIIMGSLLAMFITGICGIAFAQMITAPIKALTTNSKKLAAGNSISRIPVEATDEIGELTQSFNYMASQLSMTMEVITSEKNKLEKIFEHMADGVMAFNRQGMLIHVNSACYEMIGTLNMEHRFSTIFDNMGIKMNFNELLQGKVRLNPDKIITIGDKCLSMHSDVYLNGKKELDGVVILIQDVTKKQRLDQMRKEFVANVSHELRTPLTTVKSYTETLLDGAIEEKEIAMHFLGVMDKEADRMTALVKDLLELSRIDNSQIQLNMELLDVKALVDEVVEAQLIHIEKQGHKLVYKTADKGDYFIKGDSARIKQVMHNILSNAIKYSPDPGTITVNLDKDNDKHIVIEIADTGLGIPKEDIERIFERFYRVDKARSRKLGGTGLGLSIAKELVELHKGKIKIKSQVGVGTTVILQFNEEEFQENEDFL